MLLLKSVHFPQVLQSVQALVHPVRLQKLTIEPVNLLVSIHASLKLYIASDHTPLSFSLFERGPLCTTARQLVHALAMHYAAGALFRAGKRWMEVALKSCHIIHTIQQMVPQTSLCCMHFFPHYRENRFTIRLTPMCIQFRQTWTEE